MTNVIAGDIGGTKTLLQLVTFDGLGAPEVLAERRFASGDYPDLVPMLETFLQAEGVRPLELHGACFGVAGPVLEQDGRQTARLTNLPWRLDSQRIAQELRLEKVRLVNDFQAVGYGIEALGTTETLTLQEGAAQPQAPRVVLGAGTGLGVGLLLWQDDHYESWPTEGGHIDFAPTNAQQDALLQALRASHGRVSYERILSGPGLEAIYRFLRSRSTPQTAMPDLLQEADPAAAISRQALVEAEPVAQRALDLFIDVYGALAGNFALVFLARGGVYIAGGIAPKILSRLQRNAFIHAFNDKGRMREITQTIPVHVVINAKVGLLGAALAARRLVT